jgi:hypothetical protein
MREVEVSRTVRARPEEVRRALTPAALVEYEGSFRVRDVREQADRITVVTAGARGLTVTLRFEERDGDAADDEGREWLVRYEQEGDSGPFEQMRTWVSVRPENEGSRVTMRSAVGVNLPLGRLSDRIAAWKRRGELKRALDALAEAA